MALVFQLLLAVCVTAGVFCYGEQSGAVEVPPVSDVYDSGYYGMDDAERDAEAMEPSTEQETGNEEVIISVDGTTTTRPQVGRHWPRRGPHYRRGPLRHHHHGRRPRGPWTAEEKLTHVCNALNSSTNSRRERKMSLKLARLTPEKRQALLNVLEARKTEMKKCCALAGAARTQCTEEMSNQRYDRVCNDEEALCIWAVLKRDQSNSVATETTPSPTKERCCALEGTERYTCFIAARAAHGDKYRRNKHGDRSS